MGNSWMDTIRVLYKSEENKTADIKCNQHVDQCGAYATILKVTLHLQ